MSSLILYVIYVTFAGVVSTALGGILSIFFPKKSKRFLCCTLEFAAGLMLAIVFLDLIPSAVAQSDIITTILGLSFGVLFMRLTHDIITIKTTSLVQTGMIMAIGITLHNFPEGLALGVTFDFDSTLAFALLIAIFVHNIPEGLAFAIPLRLGGMQSIKIIGVSIITGLSTGFGGLLGIFIGDISGQVIGLCLALAAGAMLSIILSDILPKSKQLYRGSLPFYFHILGIILGIVLSFILK